MTAATAVRPVIVAPADLPRDEWLAARRRGIGGSDLAAILGMDPRRSPLGVYYDKLGQLPDENVGEAAEWGVLLEDVVARQFGRKTGLDVRPSPGILGHPDRPWQIANVDRLVAPEPDAEPDALLEVKTASAFLDDQWDRDGDPEQVPDRAALQVHHYLGVTGFDRAHVAVLIGGQRYRSYLVRRDDELIEHLTSIEAEFWDRVLRRRPPPADGSKATTELLGHLYDVQPDLVRVLDAAEVEPLLEVRAVAKAAEKAAKQHADEAENVIKTLLGEAEVGVVDGRPVVTWKTYERVAYTVAPSTHRRFNVKKRESNGR